MTEAGPPDEPGDADEPGDLERDDLSLAVPGRVSEAGDEFAAGEAPPGARVSAAVVLGLLSAVVLVAVGVILLLLAGGPPPSPEKRASEPLNPRPRASPSGLAGLGKPVFETRCASCHALDGGGGSGPSLRARRVALAPDAAILAVVRDGKGEMAPVPLTPEEGQQLILYIRYLQGL